MLEENPQITTSENMPRNPTQRSSAHSTRRNGNRGSNGHEERLLAITDRLAAAFNAYKYDTAIECGQRAVSYGMLDAEANRLTEYLQTVGVTKDSVVALLLENRIQIIAASIAVLRAGAAFAILDPSMPGQRLRETLAHLEPQCLLLSDNADKLAPDLEKNKTTAARIIELTEPSVDSDSSDSIFGDLCLNGADIRSRSVKIHADDKCYIFFTSGSTGTPKGIVGRAKSLAHFIEWEIDTLGVTAGWRVSQLTPPSFDAFLRDILVPLCSGGTICVPPTPVFLMEDEELVEWIDRNRIDLIHCVPSLFHRIARTVQHGNQFQCLKYVLMAGETLQVADVERWRSVFGDKNKLVNLYGSTETTMVKFFHIVGESDLKRGYIPIGKPMRGCRAAVLDEHGNMCAPGTVGELYIRTPYLTLGYHNDPQKTREVFVSNPFSDDPRDIVYKTGDLVQQLDDGTFRFLGRIDHQVKLRGIRVELGEIEFRLQTHENIASAAVVADGGNSAVQTLIAYVVAVGEGDVSPNALRAHLKSHLPDYMIPSAFVFLDALPLTPNGKIDRRALPAPELARSLPDDEFVAPRTPTENTVAQIWAELLGVERVGMHDNFFDIGGHSLLATQVVSRVRVACRSDVSLRQLFEAPTIADLAALIDGINESTHEFDQQPIVPLDRTGQLPLSFAQQRLWFFERLELGRSTYTIPLKLRLSGRLNAEALQQTLTEIVRRHEILRQIFVEREGEPPAAIAMPGEALPLPVIDLTYLDEEQREAEARRLAAEEQHGSFDLLRGPLLRLRLLRLQEQDHILLLTMHHIVSDALSVRVFLRELSVLYEAYCEGRSSPLAELPIQYADFAHWQRELLQGDVLEGQLAYWKEQLAGAPPALELPTDRPRPAVQTFRGAQAHATLPPALSEELQALSQREGATLFMTLLATFQLLLSRYTGQDDIVVGTPIAGRQRPEVEDLIGLFVNTLVMRGDLSGDPTFRELLGRVREAALGAYAHQDLPFEKLVEELRPPRDLSRPPLFQVMLNMQNLGDTRLQMEGLDVEFLVPDERESKFDLTLYVRERDEQHQLHLVYNADLFAPERMDDLLAQFQQLLQQIVQQPDAAIGHYSLVTSAARPRLPNPTQALRRQWHGGVHEQFSRQAELVPDRCAVQDRFDRWSYRALDDRSNQLAHYLREAGIGKGAVVGIYAQREATLAWALLGVLKAGASFAIFDPAYPQGRLIECLGRARPVAWIELEGTVPPSGPLKDCLDAIDLACRVRLPRRSDLQTHPVAGCSQASPLVRVGPDDRAYIAFTSGTTGGPQAIEGTHGPLSHFLDWHVRRFELGRDDRFSMLSGLSHDPLLRDIFTPLWLGATLCAADVDDLTPDRLAAWLRALGVTVAHLTPALGTLLAASAEEQLSSLRWLFFGGDRLTQTHLARIRQVAPQAGCVNFYGATETPQAVAHFVASAAPEPDPAPGQADHQDVPLGRGIADAQLLLLNSSQRLAGIGELGEICVRTPHLAIGYLGQDALTAERFPANPLGNSLEDRVFRTGDLGRYRPDGSVEYAGRHERQINLRGFRIEPADIEAAACRHDDVHQALVVARDYADNDRRLICYVLSQHRLEAIQASLLALLRQQLPEPMLPSAFAVLHEFPLTPNGKIDLQALPDPEVSRPQQSDFAAPRTPTEEAVAQIWAEVLGVERVGIHDNFFDLGGHSLLAVQLFARIETATGKRLPLTLLFQNPTIKHISGCICGEESSISWSSIVPIQSKGQKPPLFCIHPIGGNVLYYRDLARHLGNDQPVYGLQAKGLDGREVPFDRIEDIAADYISQIKTVQQHGPYHLAGLCFGGVTAFEMAYQLHKRGEHVAFVGLFDTYSPEHARLLRESRTLRVSTLRAFQRLDLEIGNLRLLASPSEKCRYVAEKIRRVAKRSKKRLAQFAVSSLRRLLIAARQSLPANLREIQSSNRHALRSYEPSPYAGRVTLFRATNQPEIASPDPTLGWKDLAAEGLEIIDVPGYHSTIAVEPRVHVLAEKLSRCLDDAREHAALGQSRSAAS